MTFYPPNTFGSRVVFNDCTERRIDVVHAHGSTMMTMHMQLSRHKEVRVSTGTAADLSFIFGYFARHQTLPDWEHQALDPLAYI